MEASEQLYNITVKAKDGEYAGITLTEGIHTGPSAAMAAWALLAERINTGSGMFFLDGSIQHIPIQPNMSVTIEAHNVEVGQRQKKEVFNWTLKPFFPEEEQPEKS